MTSRGDIAAKRRGCGIQTTVSTTTTMQDTPLIIDLIYTVFHDLLARRRRQHTGQETAESITQRGRESITRTKELIDSMRPTHGDTDSAMLSTMPE